MTIAPPSAPAGNEIGAVKVSESQKRYLRGFIIGMGLYVVVLVASQLVYNRLPEHPLSGLVLLLPVIPVLYAFAAFIRSVREMDELQQRIQMEAFAFSLGLTGILTFTYGFLETAGWPHLPLIWVFPISILLWGVGVAIASRRYK